jgi:phage terminase large subunit-like protein
MNNVKVHPSTQYALDVVEGKKYVVGQSEYLACKRHLDDLKRQGSKNFPWVFDEEKANRVYDFFGYCVHVEGDPKLVGTPIKLIPFQKFVYGCMFGWVHYKTGYRRFKQAYLQFGRKNAKTTTCSGLANYAMVGDKEESPRVYCAATDKDQARLLYDNAKVMGEKSPDISKRLNIKQGRIVHRDRGGSFMPLSKDTRNKDALNPSFVIIDEYHSHPTSVIYDAIVSARAHRPNMMLVIITTAGVDAEKSPCFREYQYCKAILNKTVVNERYFICICEMDKDDDEHDENNWKKANPLIQTLPDAWQELREEHDMAFDSKDPDKIRTFRIKRLNKWVYDSEDSYMSGYLETWDSFSILPLDRSTPEERRNAFALITKDMPCIAGGDLGKKLDLTADGFLFYFPEEDKIGVCAHGFLPEEAIARHEKTDKIPYRDWANEGWMTLTEGAVTDYDSVDSHLDAVEEQNDWNILEFAYDPYNATHLANQLIKKGRKCIEIRQGVQTLSEPTKLFREYVAKGKVVHDGNPLLKWALGNAKEVHDNNENIKLSKKNKDDTQRIDPAAAIMNAMVRFPVLKSNQGRDISGEILDKDWGM